MCLPPCLKRTGRTQLEQAETVNTARAGQMVPHFLTDKMLLGEEVLRGGRNNVGHVKG